MLLSRRIVAILSIGLIVLSAGVVFGQDYPNKPIRIITAGVGGGSDFSARLIGQGISGSLGQSVIVDNRGGVPSSEAVAKAPPDGYTLLLNGGSTWILPLLQKSSYDMKDFSPVVLVTKDVSVLAVHPSLPVKSVKDLIALAKAKPGLLNYGSATSGSSSHLAGELFRSMAGVNITWVPFKISSLAVTALIGGEIQLMIVDASSAAPHVKAGKLRALGVTSIQPSVVVPDVPPIATSGLPGYEAVGLTAIWVPAKTPEAIINRLNQEIVRFLNTADAKERFFNVGSEILGSSPQEAAAIINADTAKMSKVIKDAGIRTD